MNEKNLQGVLKLYDRLCQMKALKFLNNFCQRICVRFVSFKYPQKVTKVFLEKNFIFSLFHLEYSIWNLTIKNLFMCYNSASTRLHHITNTPFFKIFIKATFSLRTLFWSNTYWVITENSSKNVIFCWKIPIHK